MDGIIDNLKPGRSEDDLVYEILLKMGYPLTADLAAMEIDGLTVYTVERGSMLICLQPGVTAEIVEKLAEREPQKIVLVETPFPILCIGLADAVRHCPRAGGLRPAVSLWAGAGFTSQNPGSQAESTEENRLACPVHQVHCPAGAGDRPACLCYN
jgi:hypothetical protein